MNYEEEAYEFSKEMNRISPFLFMRKFQITFDLAKKICESLWLRQHLEARKLAKEIEM